MADLPTTRLTMRGGPPGRRNFEHPSLELASASDLTPASSGFLTINAGIDGPNGQGESILNFMASRDGISVDVQPLPEHRDSLRVAHQRIVDVVRATNRRWWTDRALGWAIVLAWGMTVLGLWIAMAWTWRNIAGCSLILLLLLFALRHPRSRVSGWAQRFQARPVIWLDLTSREELQSRRAMMKRDWKVGVPTALVSVAAGALLGFWLQR
ncbi:hypothetical protein [Nostocoides japonicum]|nr:hypothetical protein [Tetrasphaera japonica]